MKKTFNVTIFVATGFPTDNFTAFIGAFPTSNEAETAVKEDDDKRVEEWNRRGRKTNFVHREYTVFEIIGNANVDVTNDDEVPPFDKLLQAVHKFSGGEFFKVFWPQKS